MSAGTPAVWGIVNVTPDSFSDGGRFAETESAVAHARTLAAEGADVLDVGGESTRPGAGAVTPEEEIDRVVPVIRGLKGLGVDVPISVDTRKAAVAAAALEAGAAIVNDVTAGTHDPELLSVAASRGASLVLMHIQGTPETMQAAPRYDDVVSEVRAWLGERVREAAKAGLEPDRLWVDPGIGFGKTVEHNLELLRHLEALVEDGVPVLIGTSRKSFLGHLTGRDVHMRMPASLATVCRAADAGVAALRVHDVAATVDALRVWQVIRRA